MARFIALEPDLGEAMARRYLEQHWPDENGRDEAIAQLRNLKQALSQEDVVWESTPADTVCQSCRRCHGKIPRRSRFLSLGPSAESGAAYRTDEQQHLASSERS